MDAHGETTHSDHPETFNPWSIVNLVFNHLAEEGLHPVLGEAGDPGPPPGRQDGLAYRVLVDRLGGKKTISSLRQQIFRRVQRH